MHRSCWVLENKAKRKDRRAYAMLTVVFLAVMGSLIALAFLGAPS